jgi:hypothetical protein
MANIAKTYTFANGTPADGTQVNKNFDDIIAGVGDTATLHPTITAAAAAVLDDITVGAMLTTLGAAQFNCGSYTGNGAANRAITAGFQPKLVFVWSMSGSQFTCRIDATYAGEIQPTMVYLSAASAGLALSATGFVTANSGTDNASCNVNAATYRWEAWG